MATKKQEQESAGQEDLHESNEGTVVFCPNNGVHLKQWKSTDSFGRDDLLLLAKVIDQAHTWIFDAGMSKNE